MKRSTVLGTLAALALPFSAPLPGRTADETPLRCATGTIDSATAFFCAQELGYFQKAGVPVQAISSSNGSATAAAVISGSLEIGDMNVLSLVQAFEKGLPLTMVAANQIYLTTLPTIELLVPKDSPLNAPRDLNGKTLAVGVLNGIGHLNLIAWLDQHGVDLKSVKIVEIAFPVMPTALASHRVDAAVIAEPDLSVAKRNARVFAKVYDGIGPRYLISCWSANHDWVAKNADVAHHFSLAMQQASVWANHNQDKTAEITARRLNVPLDDVRSAIRDVFAETNGPGLVQPVIDVAAKYGFVPQLIRADGIISSAAA
jgi:NitT/TauT family transport system substrate-binding protein